MKHGRALAFALALSAIPFLSTSPQDAAQRTEPTRIYIVRHADRQGKEDALSPAGRARALALRDFALRQGVTAIYSTRTARTRATVEPLAKALGAEILSYPARPKASWFGELAARHAGASVVIVGHSNTVVPLVRGFGGHSAETIGHDDYRHVFVVDARAGAFDESQALDLCYGALDGAELRARAGASSRPAERATSRPKIRKSK